MLILYFDNFRGFSNGFIEINDINFLVGENSTGKTSILSIINLFSKPLFWFNHEFNNQEVELGYFDDIVSKFSINQTYFTIGFFKYRKNQCDAIVMKFGKKGMNPVIEEFRFITGNLDVHVKIRKNSIYYKEGKIDNKVIENNQMGFFNSWIINFNSLNDAILDEFILIKMRKKVMPQSIIIIINLIKSNILKEKLDFEPLEMPMLFNQFSWIAPIRTKPKTIYEGFKISFSPEGEHIPYLLRDILERKTEINEEMRKFISNFGLESGLFQSLLVKKYGKTKVSPFAINVMLSNLIFKIANVGYGVSQALPVLIDSIALSKGTCIAIQQPEIHLHPISLKQLWVNYFMNFIV